MSKVFKILILTIAVLFAKPDTPVSLDSSIYSYSLVGSFSSTKRFYGPLEYQTKLLTEFKMHFLKNYSFDFGANLSLVHFRRYTAETQYNLGATIYFIQESHGPYAGLGYSFSPRKYAGYPFKIYTGAYTQVGYLFEIKDDFYLDIKYRFYTDITPYGLYDSYTNSILFGISQYF